MNVLFYGPEYRPNLSSMIRTAEFYGLKKVYIHDCNDLLVPPGDSKKARAEMDKMARVWTAGAIEHIAIDKVAVNAFLVNYPGRRIATVIDETAQGLNDFQFKEDDLIIMGPEKEGLPESVIPFIDEKIYIHPNGHTDCLNVAVSFGIIFHQAMSSVNQLK